MMAPPAPAGAASQLSQTGSNRVEVLDAIEQSGLARWIREAPTLLAFPGVIVLHAIGMALLVGTSTALSLRTVGVAPQVPLTQLSRFFPVMWTGLGINAVSGILLLVAYPVKAFTNPVFYFKLGCIAIALVATLSLRRSALATGHVLHAVGRGRVLAAFAILAWVGAIVGGRFLAYTCRFLLSGVPC